MVKALSVSKLCVLDAEANVMLNGLSFDVASGERVGLIGASGSGKSLTAAAVCGLLRPPLRTSVQHMNLSGWAMKGASRRKWRSVRGQTIFQIFQSPASALTPGRRIGVQLKECCDRAGVAENEAGQALEKLGLPATVIGQFPYQLSGGMKQRVLIAMALILRPALLIADEPTTGLDIMTEADTLAALNEMLNETGSALVFISHDLRAVAQIADRVLVMDAGSLVEECSLSDLHQSSALAARQLAQAARKLEITC